MIGKRMMRLGFSMVFILFFILLLLLFPIIIFFGIGTAFSALGIPKYLIPSLLLLSLIGSMINIPVYTAEGQQVEYYYFSRRLDSRKTRVYLNLGGCIIPIGISAYILSCRFTVGIFASAVITAIAVAVVSKMFARIVPGMGIAMPMFIPPIASAIVAGISGSIFTIEEGMFIASYAGGVIGVLVGADILNLKKVIRIGAPKISIGGAGTFDGIFLTGIFSVMLVALLY
jgi:uncharacterized membrane protein